MSDQPIDKRIRPLFLVKPKTMSRVDVRRAEKLAFVCIVECSEPESARLLEAPPDAGLDLQARAALSLFRIVLRNQGPFGRGELTKWFCDAIVDATPPAKVPPVKRG